MTDKNSQIPVHEETFSMGTVFFPRGGLSKQQVDYIKTYVNNVAKTPKNNIILDLAEVDLIDSSSLGFLVSCLVKLREQGGCFLLVRANPYLERILRLIAMPIESDYLTAIQKIEEGVKK